MNKIDEWSWDLPTAAGLYMVCYGDVETYENIHMLRVESLASGLYAIFYTNEKPIKLDDVGYSKSHKFARLLITAEELSNA